MSHTDRKFWNLCNSRDCTLNFCRRMRRCGEGQYWHVRLPVCFAPTWVQTASAFPVKGCMCASSPTGQRLQRQPDWLPKPRWDWHARGPRVLFWDLEQIPPLWARRGWNSCVGWRKGDEVGKHGSWGAGGGRARRGPETGK